MSATEIPLRRPRLAARSGAQNAWAALPVLMAGTTVIVLDFFIVNVALASIQSQLHASASATEWIVSGYGLTFATCLVTAGRLGDRFGRRRMFSLGVAMFTLASIGCAAADSASVLVASRLLQGLAGAFISPNVLSIISVTFSGEDRVKALGIYGVVMGVAAALGQLVGGLLISADIAGLGWRAIFLINIPIGVVALLAAPRFVSESRASKRPGLDLVGMGLITLAMTAVVLPLVQGRQAGWAAWTWITLALAPVLIAEFIWYERRLARRGGAPLLDPALFTERAISAGLATQLSLWCGQASFFLVLALYLQQGRGMSPLSSGLLFTILAVTYLAASMRAAVLTVRYGRALITVGSLVLAAGHLVLIGGALLVGTGGTVVALVPGLALIGAGMGLCITPVNATVLSQIDPERAGAATGALSTFQQVGNAIGVAVIGVIFFGVHGSAHALELSVAALALLLLAVAGVSRLLPRMTAPTSIAPARRAEA